MSEMLLRRDEIEDNPAGLLGFRNRKILESQKKAKVPHFWVVLATGLVLTNSSCTACVTAELNPEGRTNPPGRNGAPGGCSGV